MRNSNFNLNNPRQETRPYAGNNLPDVHRRHPINQYNPLGTLETSADELINQKNAFKQLKSDALDRMAKADYQPAVYHKAVQYRNERSYLKKIDNSYIEIGLLADTDQLRYFGLGPYFYIQFFRRLCWLIFTLTLIQSITIYINYKGTGLSNYSASYFTYLIYTTIGNYSGSVLTTNSDGYIIGLAPAATYLAIFLFYLIWKIHFFRTIAAQEEDNKDVKPQKFCLELVGLPKDFIPQSEVEKFFSAFGPIYEVSVVRNYQDQLGYFQDLDELEQQIKEQELQLALGGDDSNRKEIADKKEKKTKLESQLNTMQINPVTVSVFVHFQFQKSKVECLSYFNEHYLFDTCSHSCVRNCCCCCVDKPDQKAIFRNQTLMVYNQLPPTPADINWQFFQLTCCGKLVRIIFAFLIIIVFLAISTTIIGICGIYISSHSNNCDSVDLTPYSASTVGSTGNSTIIRCYCNAHLVDSYTDQTTKTTCSDYLKDIYIEQAIQYVVLITSVLSNIIFGFVVDKLINCVRPSSKASGLYIKTAIYTLFLVINTILVPIFIYADIFGFQPTKYVSFLTIISKDVSSFLQVETLSFYPTFTTVWYRNVGPIFMNYIIFNTLGVWGSYIFFRCCCSSTDSLEKDEGKILQKHMNQKITEYKLDVFKEASNLNLILCFIGFFCAGLPVLVPLALINVVSRYITNRSLLQSYSTQVDGLGEDFSSLAFLLFPFILILFPLLGCWMIVSNSSIYPYGLPTQFTFLNFLKGHFTQLDMEIYLPFYLLISIIAVAELVIYHSIIKFCACLCSACYQKKEVRYHSRPFSEYTKSMNILSSYNIRNNDQMRNAVLHLEKYLVNKQ